MYKNRSEMLKDKLKESKSLVSQIESVYINKLEESQKKYEECENEKQKLLLQLKEIQEGNSVNPAMLSLPSSTVNQSVIIYFNIIV